MSEKRGSNPRPSAWEADALPLSYSRWLLEHILKLINNLLLFLSLWVRPSRLGRDALPLSYSRLWSDDAHQRGDVKGNNSWFVWQILLHF